MATVEIVIKGVDETSGALSSIKSGLEGVSGAAGKAQSAGGGFFSTLAATAGGFLAANIIGGISAQFSSFISGAISDARQANEIMAQTQAVLASTGNAAGVTAQHVADFAASLSQAAGKSKFGDDLIQQSTNLLLTFTNVRGKILDEATAISVDMAQALGGAPKDAAIQLGKALNDPIKGVTALQRVGVSFDESQKKQIETMMRAGNIMGAQKIILGELTKEFGGSAAAAAEAAGPWAQLSDQAGELGEQFGGMVLPILNQLGTIVTSRVMPAIQGLMNQLQDSGAIQSFGNVLVSLANGSINFLANVALPGLVKAWHAIQPAVQVAAQGLAVVGEIFAALSAEASGWGEGIVDQLAGGILAGAEAVASALQYIGSIITYWLQPNSPPKITPDLDKWGTAAAQVYIDSWSSADVGTLKDLGSQIQEQLKSLVDIGQLGETDVIPMVLGSRSAIADAIEQVRQTGQVTEEVMDRIASAAGPAASSIMPLARSYLNLEAASKETASAQDALTDAQERSAEAQRELSAVTEEYRSKLNPLNDELRDIQDKKQAIEDQKRLAELQAEASDTSKSDADRQIAQLEILELQKKQQIDGVEKEQRVAQQAAQQKIDAAKADQDAAQAKYDAAKKNEDLIKAQIQAQQDQLSVTRENNSLIAEQTRLLEEQEKKSAGGGGGKKGGAGGIGGGGISIPKPTLDATGVTKPLDDINKAFTKTSDVATNTVGAIKGIWSGVASAFQGGGLTQIVAGIGAAFTASLVPGVLSSVSAFSAAAVAAAPVIGILAGVGLAAAALAGAWQNNFGNIRGATAGALSAIQGLVSSVLGQILGFWNTYGGQIVVIASKTWSDVQVTVGQLVSALLGVITPILQQITAFVNAHGTEIKAFFANAWTQINSIIQSALGIIRATIVPILQGIGAFIQQHGAQIQQVLASSWTIASTIVSTVLKTIAGVVKATLQLIQGDWSGAWNTIKETCATIVVGIVTIIEATLKGIGPLFKLAMEAAVAIVLGFVGRFTTVGANIIEGMIQGVKGGVGALASAVKDAAMSALNAAKNALGIHSPSKEADQQVGVPFVQGIVQGIVKSSSLITKAARTLSKQLTDEMKKVAQEAAKAFEQVLRDQLGAAVGFDTTNLSNLNAVADIRGDSSDLKDLQGKKDDLNQAQKEREEQFNKESEQRAKEHRDRLAELTSGTAVTRKTEDYNRKVGEINQKATADELERQAKIREVQSSVGWAEDKAAKIAEINKSYDEKSAANKKQLDDLNLSRTRELEDQKAAIQDENTSYAEAQRKAQDDLNHATQDYQKQLSDLQSQIDTEALREEKRSQIATDAQNRLKEAEAQANEIRKTDSAAADKYYQMRSQQILESAKTQADIADAEAAGDKQKVALLFEQLKLQGQLHQDQAAQAKQDQKDSSPYAGLQSALTDVRDKLLAEVQHDQYFRDMNKVGSEKYNKINREVTADMSALNGVQSLLDQVASAISAGVATGVGGDTSLVDAIKASMDAAVAAAQQALGIHSPSKVFEEQVGEPSGDGIVKGITKTIPKVSEGIARMATSGANAARGAIASFTGNSNTSSSSSASVVNNYFELHLHTNSNDTEDVQSQFRMMQARIAGT